MEEIDSGGNKSSHHDGNRNRSNKMLFFPTPTKAMKQDNFCTLGDQGIISIFVDYLSIGEMVNLALTCRRFCSMIFGDDKIWKSKYYYKYGQCSIDVKMLENDELFKFWRKRHYRIWRVGNVESYNSLTIFSGTFPLDMFTPIWCFVMPHPKRIVCGREDGSVVIIDWTSRELLSTVISSSFGTVISILCVGKCIITGNADTNIHVWKDQQLQNTFTGHQHEVSCLCVRSSQIDGELEEIVSGSCDKTIRVWSMKTGKSYILGKHTLPVLCLFDFDGKYLFSGGSDLRVCVWEYERRKRLHIIHEFRSSVNAITGTILNGCPMLVAGCADTWIRLFGVCFAENKFPLVRRFRGSTSPVESLSVVGNCVIVASTDLVIRVWCLERGVCFHHLTSNHENTISGIAIDSRAFYTCSHDGSIKRWKFF